MSLFSFSHQITDHAPSRQGSMERGMEHNEQLNQKNQTWNKRIGQLLHSHFQLHTVLLLPVSLAISCITVLLNYAQLPAPFLLRCWHA